MQQHDNRIIPRVLMSQLHRPSPSMRMQLQMNDQNQPIPLLYAIDDLNAIPALVSGQGCLILMD
jgi:hypothetical protein